MTLVSRRLGYLAVVTDATPSGWIIEASTPMARPVTLASVEVFEYFDPMV